MLGIIDTQGGGLEAAEGGGGAEAGSGGRVRQAEAEMKKECRLPTAFTCHCQLCGSLVLKLSCVRTVSFGIPAVRVLS